MRGYDPIGFVVIKGTAAARFAGISEGGGIRYTIPRKRNETHNGPFDQALYRLGNRVERAIKRLKQFRRTATKYEKKGENYLAMLRIGSIQLWS